MSAEIVALSFEFSGKLLIAITVLLVHMKVRREKRIDKKVLREMRLEQTLGIGGIILMSLGYIMQLYFLL